MGVKPGSRTYLRGKGDPYAVEPRMMDGTEEPTAYELFVEENGQLNESNIGDATGFPSGEPFENEQQVRDYFTVETQRLMFGDEAIDDQELLDEMADAVIKNRWHMETSPQLTEEDYAAIRAREQAVREELDSYAEPQELASERATELLRYTAEKRVEELTAWGNRFPEGVVIGDDLVKQQWKVGELVDSQGDTRMDFGTLNDYEDEFREACRIAAEEQLVSYFETWGDAIATTVGGFSESEVNDLLSSPTPYGIARFEAGNSRVGAIREVLEALPDGELHEAFAKLMTEPVDEHDLHQGYSAACWSRDSDPNERDFESLKEELFCEANRELAEELLAVAAPLLADNGLPLTTEHFEGTDPDFMAPDSVRMPQREYDYRDSWRRPEFRSLVRRLEKELGATRRGLGWMNWMNDESFSIFFIDERKAEEAKRLIEEAGFLCQSDEMEYEDGTLSMAAVDGEVAKLHPEGFNHFAPRAPKNWRPTAAPRR